MNKLFLFFLFLLFQQIILAKIGNPPVKWGKFTKEELEMKSYDYDSTASAVILTKFGSVSFDLINDELKAIYEYHVRIKILNKAGFKYGDVKILYKAKSNIDKFIDFKAHTINIDETGKTIETNVSKDLILDEDVNGYFHRRKFAFPNLQEGSIIEYYYKIKSDDVFFLKTWYFQDEIPIKWCEYRANIPEVYEFSVMSHGNDKINKIEKDNSHLMLHDISSRSLVRSEVDMTSYIMLNVDALLDEPYSIFTKNYCINMQLLSVQTPGSMMKKTLEDWDKFAEFIHEASWFGDQIHGITFVKDIVTEITGNMTDQKEKIMSIYNYVKDNIVWNGEKDFYIDDLKTSFKRKTGNSTEVNAILLCMLRAAGVSVDPVLVSTRDHGEIKKAFTFINQFNHTIVRVKSGNETYFLDATDPFRSMDLMNAENLNIIGFAAHENKYEWVYIDKAPPSKSSLIYFLTLDKEDKITGKLLYSCTNYLGIIGRKSISKKGLKEYFSDLIDEKSFNINSDSVLMQNFDSIKNNLIIKSNISGTASSGDKFIYLTPYINADLHENPFKKEKRQNPVEFYFPIDETSNLTLQFPSGYKISEIPKSIKVTLPDSAASFTFVSASNNNTIQLKTSLVINKLYFPVDEYDDLREFFANISKKFSEQIVLSKE